MTKRNTKHAATAKPESRLLRVKKVRNPNPPPPPKEYQFKPGQSGNPGGRPKLLSEAYRTMLAEVDPETGLTKAEIIARARYVEALGKAGTQASREIWQATEGERIRTWRDDVIDLLREGKVTADDVKSEFGVDEAEPLIVAAGIRRDEGGQVAGEGGEAHDGQ